MEELTGPLNEIFADFKRKFKEFQDAPSFWETLQGFIHAIDWTEPWIVGLVSYMALMIVLAILTRKRTTVQTVLFAQSAGVVYMGERLNKLGAKHWESFSRQHYFDPHGIFFSAMVSGPLLIVMFIVLVNYLLGCAGLLVEAKRNELRHKARARRQAAEASGGASGSEADAGGSSKSKTPAKTPSKKNQ